MQIRSRLTIQFFLITAALLLLALVAIYFFSARIQRDQFYSTLEDRANTTADLLIRVEQVDSSLLKSSLLKVIDLNKKDILDHENVSVYESTGRELYTNNDTIHFEEILPDLDHFLKEVQETGEKKISVDRMDIVGLEYRHKNERFLVVAGAIDTHRLINLLNLRKVLALVFIFILLVIGMAGWIFAGRALRPISNVIRQVDEISVNNLDQRIDEGNKRDEIARLTMQFNHLLERIDKAFTTQKMFVANASHELRNPLAVITSQLEVTLLNKRSTSEYEAVLASVLEDIKRLNNISHQLLLLARLESESALLSQDIRVDELLWEIRDEFRRANPDTSVELSFETLPEDERGLFISGSREFLNICFFNLAENACKFSPDKAVRINFSTQPGKAIISFSDNGPGIDQADLPHVFEPFFRSKKNNRVKGYGVGLSIVDKIVRAHHATMSVNTGSSGTIFTLTFSILKF
jgi:signal transduction histidine kinase